MIELKTEPGMFLYPNEKERVIHAFFWAAQQGDEYGVEFYLSAGLDPNIKDAEGSFALIKAAGAKNGEHLQIVQRLLEAGADINAREDCFGSSALMEAAAAGNIQTVQLLLKSHADVNAASKNGFTPLMAAAFKGHLEIVSLLVKAGANVNAQTDEKETALTMAKLEKHAHVAAFLESVPQKVASRTEKVIQAYQQRQKSHCK